MSGKTYDSLTFTKNVKVPIDMPKTKQRSRKNSDSDEQKYSKKVRNIQPQYINASK